MTERQDTATARKCDETARKCDETMADYAYTVTHDLNAPLRHISQYGALLKEEAGLGAQGMLYVERMVACTQRLSQTVNDLSAFAHIIHFKEERQRLDPGHIIAEVEDRLAAGIEASGAVIRAGPFPVVEGYPFAMQEIFYHLIRNALDYRGRDAPVIAIRCVRRAADYLFSVHDNGMGIPEKHRRAVFKALKRLHAEDDIPGTGLGLAICEKAVAAHGGEIWVESRPEGGSTFFFTILRGSFSANRGNCFQNDT